MRQLVTIMLLIMQSAVAQDSGGESRKRETNLEQQILRAKEQIFDDAATSMRAGTMLDWESSDVDAAVSVCNFYRSIGRNDEADSLFQLALAATRRKKDQLGLETLLAWKGRDSLHRGRFDNAKRELEEALSIAEVDHDPAKKIRDIWADLSQLDPRLGPADKAAALAVHPPPKEPMAPMEPLSIEGGVSSYCRPDSVPDDPTSPERLGRHLKDENSEILRLLAEDSTRSPTDFRFTRLLSLRSVTERAEGEELRRTLIATMLSSKAPVAKLCVEELLGEPYGSYHEAPPQDRIRLEIAKFGLPAGGTDIGYLRTVDPRIEAAIDRADIQAAATALGQLRWAAMKPGARRIRFLALRSQRALAEACEQAGKHDLAKTLSQRQLADAQAWFGRADYYYASALHLRIDVALKQKDYATANAMLPRLVKFSKEVARYWDGDRRIWQAELEAQKTASAQ